METVAFTLQDIADLEAEGTPLLKCTTGSTYKIQITRAEQYSFEVLIVDEFGESVTQPVELAVTHLGETLNLTTDSSGKLILNVNTTDGTVFVRFTESSVKELYAMMKSQWQQCPRFSSGDRERLVQSETISTTTLRPSLIETEFKIEVNKPHRISIQPHVVMARMRGLNFDTNKCFMLPTAVQSMKTLCDIYNDNQETELLLVGHTDTTGDGAYNDTLSLERAEAIRAYLTDDVESWYTWYEASSEKKRWGKTEDQQMLVAVFEHYSLNDSGDKLTIFQKWHNGKLAEEGENAEKLDEDGIIGPQTRRALIKRYMGVDNTSLPQNIMITVHGCGENFPLDATEHEIDNSAPDSKEDLGDRRVELFFFDKETGVLPQPPGKNSESGSMEYPEWRARAQKIDVGIKGQDTLYLWLLDSNKKPMPPGTPWKMTMGEIERRGTLQHDGLVTLTGVPINDHEKITVQWGTASQWEFAQSDNATVVPAHLQNL